MEQLFVYICVCVCVCVRFMKASALYNISNLYLLTFYFIFLLNRYVSALSEYTGQANLQSAVSSGWPASLHYNMYKHLLCLLESSCNWPLNSCTKSIIFILIVKPNISCKTPDSLILQIIISPGRCCI